MEVSWGRVYASFTPICVSYFIALVTNSSYCWHRDHPRPFPEGSHHCTAQLSKQGLEGPGNGAHHPGQILATSQPRVKARSGSGRKPKLRRKDAGMWSQKSPSLRIAFWGSIEAVLFETQPPFSSPAVIWWLASNFSHVFIFLLPFSLLSTTFLLSPRLRNISMWN